jgi:hypothetical protein
MANSNSSSKRGKRNSRNQSATPQDEVVAAFNGCARCSFFLAGYRLLHDDFDKAVDDRVDGFLKLSWDHAVNQLVYKSFGIQLEADAYYLQGSCQFCRRAFIFEAGNGDGEGASLQIAVKNR